MGRGDGGDRPAVDRPGEFSEYWRRVFSLTRTDQCDFGHDSNRKLLDGSYCGQNAASGYSTSGAAVQVEVVSLLLLLLHLLLLAIHILAGLV